jgi:hypothetical protein
VNKKEREYSGDDVYTTILHCDGVVTGKYTGRGEEIIIKFVVAYSIEECVSPSLLPGV